MITAQPDLRGVGLRIGIVWSRFNEEIVQALVTACDKQLVELGVAAEDIDVVSVPGALEIPLALQVLAHERRGFTHRYDALVALGAVIRGETSQLFKAVDADYLMSLLPPGSPSIVIPEAEHHVMIDQPLAFVSALRALLATWPAASFETPASRAPQDEDFH